MIRKYILDLIEEFGAEAVKKFGLGAVVKGFYLGMDPSDPTCKCSFSELAEELGIGASVVNLWEDLWYGKSVWMGV